MSDSSNMRNAEIAAAFAELAERTAVTDPQPYRMLAYKRAADSLRKLPVSIATMAREGQLGQLEGVGPAIAKKIEELLATGSFKALDRAREAVPDGLLQLMAVEGIGRTSALRIWEQVAAQTYEDVVTAADDGRLGEVSGVGAKTVASIVAAASQTPSESTGPALMLRDEAEQVIEMIAALLSEAPVSGLEVYAAGSYARGAELVECVAMLLVAPTDPSAALDAVCELLDGCGWEASAVLAAASATIDPSSTGPAAQHLHINAPSGVPVDLYVADRETAPAASLIAVGPPEHARAMLERIVGAGSPAISMLELSEHAELFPDHAAYRTAGLPYIPPELRDRPDVLEQAAAQSLPVLVQLTDLQAELHCHSTWSDGRHSIAAMAQAAKQQGDSFMAITDHSAPLAMVGGLGPEQLIAQRAEIDQVNAELAAAFTVLHGSEVEVLPDGSLGLPDDALELLDWVVASVHTSQRQDAATITERVERVLRHPLVDCVGHPTSRLLLRRPSTQLDTERLIVVAAETGTILEINANPRRLDIDADTARAALAAGVLLSINSDAHGTNTLHLRSHGVAIARRAGARAQDVVNTYSLEQLRAVQKRWR